MGGGWLSEAAVGVAEGEDVELDCGVALAHFGVGLGFSWGSGG